MSYERVISEFRNRVWAVRAETFTAMLELMAKWSRGERFSREEVQSRILEANYGHNRAGGDRQPMMLAASGRSRRGRAGSVGSVALIPVVGLISHRASMFSDISAGGGTNIEELTSQFRSALAQPSVRAIVFDIDSPGGSVDGVFELAGEIAAARGRKRIISVSNTLAASAAYAIGAAASEFVIAPSSMTGSVGVFASHEDHSKELERQGVKISYISAGKYKSEGGPTEPLSDEARADLQSKVDDFYQMFVRVVATCRGDSQSNVREGYGQGRVVTAVRAVRANLADRIGTLDDVLEGLGVNRLRSSSAGTRMLEAGDESYSGSLGRRRRQLALSVAAMSTKPDPEDDEDDSACGCDCEACKACTRKLGMGAGEGFPLGCACACDACKACENGRVSRGSLYRPRLAAARLRLLEAQTPAASIHRRAAMPIDYRVALARRQRELDRMV